MSRIVCFGEALIDFHAQDVADPKAGPAFVPYAGGAPANVAVAIARLGGNAAFVGMFGKDVFGDMLLRDLGTAGVDTRHIRRTDAANTALAFVARDAHGERSFTFYRPPAADLLFRDSDFDDGVFNDASIFHAGSCSLTEPAIAAATMAGMRCASAAGALVSFDMNLRPALWMRDEDPTPRLWEALAAADVAKLSAEELAFIVAPMGDEKAAIARLWSGRAKLLVVTDGDKPMRWFARGASGSLPGFGVRAVDSTGAGDAFVGGLLHGLVIRSISIESLDSLGHNAPLRDALLRYAAACGALAVTRIGSFAAMPDRDAVKRFLEAQA